MVVDVITDTDEGVSSYLDGTLSPVTTISCIVKDALTAYVGPKRRKAHKKSPPLLRTGL
jgi:hypothetical protein